MARDSGETDAAPSADHSPRRRGHAAGNTDPGAGSGAARRGAGFEGLRKELADIAKRKDRGALAQRVAAKDFFWERDFSGSFDPRRPSIDNLAAALTLEADDGSGWDALAAFAAETSAGPLPGRPSVICAPAIPQFDQDARGQLVESTQSDGLEWNYPRAGGL